jgi:hypothetical protein
MQLIEALHFLHSANCSYQQQQQQQHTNPSLKPRHLRKLQTQLRFSLTDFSSFLLTTEQTHFSMLSVIANYPGLVHFVYTDGTGVMLRPIVTDLRHQAEILGHGRWKELSVDVINTAVSNISSLLWYCFNPCS